MAIVPQCGSQNTHISDYVSMSIQQRLGKFIKQAFYDYLFSNINIFF